LKLSYAERALSRSADLSHCFRSAGVLALALSVCLFAFPASGLEAPAKASTIGGSLFIGGWYDDRIAKVGFDGSDPVPGFVPDDGIPEAMTVSGDFLYWQANSSPVRIGRARIDGGEVNPQFIRGGPGLVEAEGISVGEGRLYWTETRNSTGFGPAYLSSANLDGSDIRLRQRSLGGDAAGPAIVADGYVFFLGERSARGVTHWSIVRRRLASSGNSRTIAPDRSLVHGTLAVQGDYLYWVESEDHGVVYIARASLDGSSIDTRFRRVPRKGCHLRSEMNGGAIGGGYYFIGCASGRVDRLSLTGRRRLLPLRTGAKVSSGPVLAATP
jgi:hypothetical protein